MLRRPPPNSPLFSLQVRDESEFVDRLGCGDVAGVKVLSIFGNTGDGKSHTLNHILFNGESVFYTSKSPSSCTVGVWAAYNPELSLVALDTEGLLGAAVNQNQRMRLLLKVILMICDWFCRDSGMYLHTHKSKSHLSFCEHSLLISVIMGRNVAFIRFACGRELYR